VSVVVDSVLLGCTFDLLPEGEVSGIFMKLTHKPANISIDEFLCRKIKGLQVL